MKRSTTILASVAIILGGAATAQILDGGDTGALIIETGPSSAPASNQVAASPDGTPQ
ncbi:low affinity iron permease family protein [Nocardia iowensis]|uniref:Low affinity iron permease family protein n=1 Tax=Nocardia iowensis TaxID=204891 RepID=A0ABX8RJ53_NOCIO|nr:low affinity iron permease family protein [Nocardia iowensis]QXN89650.1 low affinity iron permease family protein [Nocardia iowensis]